MSLRSLVLGVVLCGAAASAQEEGRTALGGSGLTRTGSALWTPHSLVLSLQGGWFNEAEYSIAGGVDQQYSLALGGTVAPAEWLELSVASRSVAHSVTYDVPSGGQG